MTKHILFFSSLILVVAFVLRIVAVRNSNNAVALEPSGGEPPPIEIWLVKVKNGTWGVYDNDGKELMAPKYDGILPEDILFNGKIFSGNGKDFSDSIPNYGVFVRYGNKWGFVNKEGEETLAPRYDSVKYFREGRAWVYTNGMWGIVDNEGRLISEPAYANPKPFHNGYAVVEKNGLFGAVDKSGRLVVPARYINLESFSASGVAVAELSDSYLFVDMAGEELPLPKFLTYREVSDGFIIENGSKKGFVTPAGQLIVPLAYQEVTPTEEGFLVKQNGRWGVVGNGGEDIVPCRYFSIDLTADGYQVHSKEFSGLYSTMGAMLVPCFYEIITKTDNGFLCGSFDKYALFSLDGDELIPWMAQYEEIQVEGANYARIKKGGLYGWYDLTKKQLAIPIQYDFVWDKFTSTEDVVKVRRDGHPLKIDYYGKEIEGKDAEEWFNEKVRPVVKKLVDKTN